MATYTESAPTLWRFQCDPAPGGTCTVQAFFRSELINDEEPSDRIAKDGGSVSFALPELLASQVLALAEAARG